MNEQADFGPWIDHDGTGCPVPFGTIVRILYEDAAGARDVYLHKASDHPAWHHGNFQKAVRYRGDIGLCGRILRYQVRKPRGLKILHELLEHLPEQVDA